MQTKKEAKSSLEGRSSTATAPKSSSKNSKTEKTPKHNPIISSPEPTYSMETVKQTKNHENQRSIDNERNRSSTAKITIKYDAGFGNMLTIRGQGADLSWQKGVELKNIKANEWVWETDATFTKCEFKILINDSQYETGPDHVLTYGSHLNYTPHFPQSH